MLSSLLLAYSLSDFYAPKTTTTPPPSAVAWSAESGQGALSVLVTYPENEEESVALGQTRIPMLTLELGASCDAPVTVQEIDLKHFGQGRSKDLRSVYALSGYRRVSRGQSFDTDGNLSLRLQRVTIPACDVLRLTIVADLSIAADPTGEHSIQLATAPSVQSTALKTEYVSVASLSSMIKSSPFDPGAVTVRFLPHQVNMLYGTIQTIARIQVTADQNGSHVLRNLTLTNAGSARGHEFIDMRLEDRKGNVLTRLTQHMDGRRVSFDFDPTYILNRGDTVLLLLRGEIRTSYAKTVDFELEEESDFVTSSYRRPLP
ncbi:MAG: hypothetical protein ABL890_00520 [Candidatus Peribacteraceae bacterium]